MQNAAWSTAFTFAIAWIVALSAQGQAVEKFEVASVRTSTVVGETSWTDAGEPTFVAWNISLKLLVQMAYDIQENQIAGIGQCGSEQYDVAAKPRDGILTAERLRPMLVSMLAERFGLVTHREMRTVSGYALVMGKGGPPLRASGDSEAGRAAILRGRIIGRATEMSVLASMVGQVLRVPVVDKTGIEGRYDVDLRFTPEDSLDTSLPSIFTAIQEQVGLKLESQRVAQEMLVVDRCEKVPTAN